MARAKWNTHSVGLPYYDAIINGKRKGYLSKFLLMKPSEFYKIQKELFDLRQNVNGEECMQYLDEGIIENLTQQMVDPSRIFVSFYIVRDEHGNLKPYEQEGRHRITVAKDLGFKYVPVWEFIKYPKAKHIKTNRRNT